MPFSVGGLTGSSTGYGSDAFAAWREQVLQRLAAQAARAEGAATAKAVIEAPPPTARVETAAAVDAAERGTSARWDADARLASAKAASAGGAGVCQKHAAPAAIDPLDDPALAAMLEALDHASARATDEGDTPDERTLALVARLEAASVDNGANDGLFSHRAAAIEATSAVQARVRSAADAALGYRSTETAHASTSGETLA